MDDAARAELARLAVDLEERRSAVDEVELVLRVVVVEEPVEAGGITSAFAPKAVTPSARRILRKPYPSPSSSSELIV